jgi:hypothetical protein
MGLMRSGTAVAALAVRQNHSWSQTTTISSRCVCVLQQSIYVLWGGGQGGLRLTHWHWVGFATVQALNDLQQQLAAAEQHGQELAALVQQLESVQDTLKDKLQKYKHRQVAAPCWHKHAQCLPCGVLKTADTS